MPRYYFDIKDGHRLVDPSGSNFKDDDDAIAKWSGSDHVRLSLTPLRPPAAQPTPQGAAASPLPLRSSQQDFSPGSTSVSKLGERG
jgi:uncharacterized protein DUF6894